MPISQSLPKTLGELRKSTDYSEARIASRSVKDELRDNLIARLKSGETIFPGIVGYEDTVVPQIVNAVLSKQNFILLGLRGQAKSRILRALTALLDENLPFVAGCEIRDNPYKPLCKRCRDLISEQGNATPIDYMTREERYVEKAARGGHHLASELTMHFGLLPRANRGIFAVNELADLAGKIQVALFNIMQEGDVQIKGYPVRLALDVALVFSANPEDYTARGKIVTPLKDRIGSEIRTHYPETIEEGIAITAQETWSNRGLGTLEIPQHMREVIEQIAFSAREDKKVDKRSGVSQRLPISTLDLVISNAERRALIHGESLVMPRIGDIYAALPGITGKLELEYEGEMRGADTVVREIMRIAIGKIFDKYFASTNTQQIEQWFNLGGTIKFDDDQSANSIAAELKQIQGLVEKLAPVGISSKSDPEHLVAAAEFLLEGMYAHHRVSRTEERGFTAQDKPQKSPTRSEREPELDADDWPQRRTRRGFN
jgi:magnesium chelatase subunit I